VVCACGAGSGEGGGGGVPALTGHTHSSQANPTTNCMCCPDLSAAHIWIAGMTGLCLNAAISTSAQTDQAPL
jgi:hypothetical protein